MRYSRLFHGPLLLLAYQVAPLQVSEDSLGRYRVTIGVGGGQWEHDDYSCDGALLSSTPVRYRSGGAQVDAWTSPRVRVTVVAGTTRETLGPTEAVDSNFTTPYIPNYAGTFGGAQLAYEGQHVGLGASVMHVSGGDQFTVAVPYLRLGNIDRAHFRLDGLPPNPAFPTTGWARFGVGFNGGHLRGTGGFFGLGFGPFEYNAKAALLGEVRVPLGPRVAGQLQGLVGPGENNAQWSAGFGLRYDFGTR